MSSETASKNILAEGQFELGADILRKGEKVFRVPSCTYWDDDAVRVIVRDGLAVVQVEHREYSGTRSWGTDEWRDFKSLGPVEGLEVVFDHPRSCCCDDCY